MFTLEYMALKNVWGISLFSGVASSGVEIISQKKEILNYSIVGYKTYKRKVCKNCHQKFSQSNDNFKSKIVLIITYIFTGCS